MYARVAGPATALPTLILEAGGGASCDWWTWVQDRLSRQTRVLSYDRAGLGRSAACPKDFGAMAVSQRLRELLAVTELPGPYLVVGHSLGGLYARGFAATHSSEVCGLVMVDPTASRIDDYIGLSAEAIRLLGGVLRILSLLARLGLLRRWHPFSGLLKGLPPEARAASQAIISDPRHLAASAGEIGAIRRIQAELAARPLSRTLSLLIVSAGERSLRKTSAGGPPEHHLSLSATTDRTRMLTVPGADHASLLTNREHAAYLADQILMFARECAVR